MLPLPRPRPDTAVVRTRLRALAQGRWEDALGADSDPVPDRPPQDRPADVPPPVVHRSSVRAVAVAVGATAVATWAVVHLTAGGAPSPVELLPGTPLASAAGVLVPAPVGSVTAAAAGATPTPSEPELVVQVVGEVRRPGLVRLPAGSRVADAVRAAGGLVPGGRTGGLNLARPVLDGEQIVVSADVPVGAAAGGGSAAAPDGGVVDLNSATAADLDALPGVGPVMAGRILDWRAAHGRFTTVDQLREVSGIGVRTFERLKPHVRV